MSLVLCGIILFGLYEDYNGSPLSRTQHILYQASSRTLWAIGLGYIILACLSNQGGKYLFAGIFFLIIKNFISVSILFGTKVTETPREHL